MAGRDSERDIGRDDGARGSASYRETEPDDGFFFDDVERDRHGEPVHGGRRAQLILPRSRRLGRFALLAGLLAVVVSGLSAAHEMAPAYLGAFARVPGRVIAAVGAVLVVLTLGLVIAARVSARRRTGRGTGVAAGGIVTLLIATLLLVLGVVTGVLFPQGMFRPSVRDTAPVSDTAAMRAGVEKATGTCMTGWQDLSSGLPGVTTAMVCKDTLTAYAVFDSTTAEKMYEPLLKTKAPELMSEHADIAGAHDWRLLEGKQWMVVGDRDGIAKLQQEWGGDMRMMAAPSQQ